MISLNAASLAKAAIFTKRGWLFLLGGVISLYAVVLFLFVQGIPDLGLRTAFDTKIKRALTEKDGYRTPQVRDQVVKYYVGNPYREWPVNHWSDVLKAPFRVQEVLPDESEVMVVFRDSQGHIFEYPCKLSRLPREELIPSGIWFCLKFLLFLVGVLVLWKRPDDPAARLFFLLCVVTLGAYLGGYHWLHILSQPIITLVFMACAVLLPAVSLHFYQVFPRPKRWLLESPRTGLGVIYGIPALFLAILVGFYIRQRWLVENSEPLAEILAGFDQLKLAIYIYLGVAGCWYLASVLSLLHSFFTVTDPTERNQVKWILFGAVLALAPITYSLILAIWYGDKFGAGGATWPMFAASFFLTAAFAISITRYRLMELDKIVSSSFGYFLISFSAGVVYYLFVFVGTVLFNQWIASPDFSAALTASATALILILGLDLARSRFKKALDRRFFRNKIQLDQTLQKLTETVQQLVDPPALAQRLLYATTELMGVTRGSVFLREGQPAIFRLVGSLGPTPELTELASGCPLIEGLERHAAILIPQRSDIPLSLAQKQLQKLGGEIAHPLKHENHLVAILILGSKETPYRHEDVHLLAAFGRLTVTALENAEGHRTIEQLNGELQTKVEKISEQQRRILALQTQLRRQAPLPLDSDAAIELKVDTSVAAVPAPGGIIGSSPPVQHLLGLVRKVAATDACVLIRGESGVGKELLARAVHETSSRAQKPFVKVHCAALSATLLESELFGHVKGAFTGAHRDKVGRFELANSGTLFLDEIGDISLEVQTKLLRVLQEKTLERVGSSDPVAVDVRIITATHQNLEDLIETGRFREDLFYRLNVFPVEVPPLRERTEDIVELAMFFLKSSAQKCRKDVTQIDDDVVALLKSYSWPGNIRQLENTIERAVVICEGPTLTLAEMPLELLREIGAEEVATAPRATYLKRGPKGPRGDQDRAEREQMVRVLAAAEGNKAEAARALGIARSTLVSRLKKLGLS